MATSVDPDQTAPIGAVCSGPTLFASILNSSVMLVAADDFSRRHFQMHFFLGALRVKFRTLWKVIDIILCLKNVKSIYSWYSQSHTAPLPVVRRGKHVTREWGWGIPSFFLNQILRKL